MKRGLTERARKKAFESIFKKFDHNQNGRIFIRDFVEELSLHDIEIDQEEIEVLKKFADEEGEVTKHAFEQYTKESELWKTLDKNRDGVVTNLEMTSKAELAFKIADKNSDGYISKAEFQKLAKNLKKEQVEKVMEKFDSDGDGKLDLEEFKKMMKK